MARVLIVDDDLDQLEIRKLLLEAEGHAVWTAASAGDAGRVFGECDPELAVVDLRLPRLEDGRAVIRELRARSSSLRIVVVSGMASDLIRLPEAELADEVLHKPFHSEKLLRLISRLAVVCLWVLWLGAGLSFAQHGFSFRLDRPAEVVARIKMSSPGSDWGREGRESALAEVILDKAHRQHVMLHAGAIPRTYSVFLGAVAAGEHELAIERSDRYSATGSSLEVSEVSFEEVYPEDQAYPALANAPILFARPNTVGRFTDVPLLIYCERLQEQGGPLLQYTVIFSNEDGGTSTRALMARWGRTTDIEYVYRAYLDSHGKMTRATIQAPDHKEEDFGGRREGTHPLLLTSTDNNMVSGDGASEVRYQLAPLVVELTGRSREQVMDDHSWTYRVMSLELLRENKLRAFGMLAGESISDPRNYLYLEALVSNRDSAIGVLVRLVGEDRWRSSHLGRADYAIERDGWVRTTVELPPGTRGPQIGEIGFQCLVAPPEKGEPPRQSGLCALKAVSKCFFLQPDYAPGEVLWHLPPERGLWEIPAGDLLSFSLDR